MGKSFSYLFVVMLGWVLFRSEDFSQAMDYYAALFSFEFSNIYIFVSAKFYRILTLAIVLSFLFLFNQISKNYNRFVDSISFSNQMAKTTVSVFLIIISVANLAGSGFNPFIYFRF